MKTPLKTVLLIVLLMITLIFSWNAAKAQEGETPPSPQTETEDGNTRSLEGVAPQLLTGFTHHQQPLLLPAGCFPE